MKLTRIHRNTSLICVSTLFGAIRANIDFTANLRVSISGHTLHCIMCGKKEANCKDDSQPSKDDGYKRLSSNRRGCRFNGRSCAAIASVAKRSCVEMKSNSRGYLCGWQRFKR